MNTHPTLQPHLADRELWENNARFHLALQATGLGTWEMDLVHDRRTWSDETLVMHGLTRDVLASGHVVLTDRLMHPDDRIRQQVLHDELRAGRDDYVFEYRTFLENGTMRWISARGKVLEREPRGPTRIVGVCADITSNKNAEDLRRFHETQFRTLANSMPQLVWIADQGGNVTFYNARRSAYFQPDAAEAERLQWQPMVHLDDLPRTIEVWQHAMQGAQDYEMEHRLRMADGRYAWHLSRATPVESADGRVAAWFGTATDIDRLKQADADVQASEERLRLATEAADMFAWEVDFLTRKMGWADNAARVIGCPPDKLGDDPDDGQFFVFASDRERVLAEFTAAMESDADTFTLEFRGEQRGGEAVYWRAAGKFVRGPDRMARRAIGITQDITRYMQAESAARILGERLATAEEGAGALTYDWDIPAGVVWRSANLFRLLGWGVNDLSSSPESWSSLVHPEDRTRVAGLHRDDAIDANGHYAMEYRVRHKDGRYIWVIDSGRAFRDPSGAIIRLTGTAIDITARKEAEESRRRMASLIELSFEPIFAWVPGRGIVEWNTGAEHLYGFGRDEALGKQSHELLRTKHPLPLPELLRLLQTSGSWAGEVEHVAKDGRPIVVESRHQLIRTGGETVVLETNRDIRERKRAEANLARIAAVAAASHDALYGATLDGYIEAWNPGAENLLGYPADEAIGKHISMLANPGQHEEQRVFLQRVAHGETIRPFDTVRKAKDGRLINVSIAMSPVKAPDGSVTAVSVALHDISERKEWEARQRMMNRELAHRVKNSFAVLQAILRSTLKSSPDPGHFAAAFSGRLHSLAAAHDVLSASDWRGAELGALLRQQLSHYVTGQRVRLSGEPVNLTAEHAAPFSLIINELATNAVKYGALSVQQGVIDVTWHVDRRSNEAAVLVLEWRESGGPKIKSLGPRGFGSTLIEKSLAGASVARDFGRNGFNCVISWPMPDFASDAPD